MSVIQTIFQLTFITQTLWTHIDIENNIFKILQLPENKRLWDLSHWRFNFSENCLWSICTKYITQNITSASKSF